ncbi:MAG: PD40 domain-containing protein [Bacteroidales bacterium]|nr:PD40 domain-containing protein [Bacteroidales bacterium]
MKTRILLQAVKYAGLVKSLAFFTSGILLSLYSEAQYFGRNKPGYHVFRYDILRTPNFDIYHNFRNDTLVDEIARMSEYWYKVHSTVFADTLRNRNPLLLYENHADFQQTNVSDDIIDVGTGGFTEGLKNRIVMPVSFTYSQTNHVLGHELVHAFQFNMISADSISLRDFSNVPLWMIEGLAEYMSIGSVDPQTAIWLRDDILHKEFPSIDDLNKKPQYNPYRYGQAFWTFTARTWGDTVIAPLMKESARMGYKAAFDSILGVDVKTFSGMWKAATETHLKNLMKDTVEVLTGRRAFSGRNTGDYNISPVLSPDGKYLAFISEKDVFTMDLYLADVGKGRIISKLSSTVRNDEIDGFNFIESSGSWSPDSRKFVYVAFIKGENRLVIIDVKKDKIIDEISIPGVKALSNPAWSPDGKYIVFTGTSNGISNLYLYNYHTEESRQLTFDKYAYIHPSWSPDGEYLLFSTDKHILEGRKTYVSHAYDLATLHLKTGEIITYQVFPGAGNLNPLFSNDGKSVYFLSDRDGYRNLYRYSIEENSVYQLTRYLTGITGITLLSQAISLSDKDQLVYTYYTDNKYRLYIASLDDFKEEPVNPYLLNYEAATLPPAKRAGLNIVDYMLLHQPELVNSTEGKFKPVPYRPKLKLDYISNTSVGVAAGRLGTGMAGSVSAIFSDMVGDNRVYANLALNGEIYDFGGQVAFLNEKKRIKWGTAVSHIPYRYGNISLVRDSLDINGEMTPVNNYITDIIRLIETNLSVFAYYPVSITRRFESGLSVSRYSYRIDRFNTYYDDSGFGIGQTREKLDAPDGFNLIQADVAYVYDNSFFGVTAPMQGARSRYQVLATMGDYNYITTLLDYRKYFFVKPVTFAFRFYNYNRFGQDVESGRIAPLYLGYPYLIRGYDGTSVREDYLSGLTVNHLTGSRLLVTNAEIRIPLTGPGKLSLIKSRYLFTDLAFFLDGGLVWDPEHHPDLKWQVTSSDDRIPLFSAGLSLRLNLFGYMVVEPYYAVPFQDGGFKNASFGINFIPGW